MRILFLLCFCSQLIIAQTGKVFPSKKYVKVIGYTFNKEFDGKMQYDESVIDPKTKKLVKGVDSVKYKLTQAQADTLLMILNDKSTFREGEAGCFFPHHAFVFYDAANKPVAYVNICFNCQQIYSAPLYSTASAGGLSKKGNEALFLFCHNLGMPSPRHVKTLQDTDFEVGDIIKIPFIDYEPTDNYFTQASIDSIKVVADFLIKHPELTVEIANHTDYRGDPHHNKRLSEDRAKHCFDYLIEGSHIPANQIIAKGYGESQPIYGEQAFQNALKTKGKQEAERLAAIDRRTELMVLKVK